MGTHETWCYDQPARPVRDDDYTPAAIDRDTEPVEPFVDWRQQTAALEHLEVGVVRGWWRALGASR